MATYLLLMKADSYGSARMLESGSKAAEAADRVLSAVGGKVREYLVTTGQYDVAILADFPGDDEPLLLSHLWNVVGLYPEALLRAYDPSEVDSALKSGEKLRPLLDEIREQQERTRREQPAPVGQEVS
jgi:uncharacterized protein with GYD domain